MPLSKPSVSKIRPIVAAILLVGASPPALPQSPGATVELVAFRPESRTLTAASRAISEITVRSRGPRTQTLWVGYSVQDSSGRWYEVPATSMTLSQDEQSTQRKQWIVPSSPVPGPYRVAMSIWNGPPGGAGATRLLAVDQSNAFRILRSQGLLMEEPLGPWRAAAHPIGLGHTRPDQVFLSGEGFRLRMLAGHCDGAEIRTADRYVDGDFQARMKVPDAPGSVSALSLYTDLSGNDNRIDFEISNGRSPEATLAAVVDGRITHQTAVKLPFDPRADFHSYAVSWKAERVSFLADGKELTHWVRGFSTRPMRIVSRVWWPTGSTCSAPADDRELLIQSLQLNGTLQR